MTAARLRNVRIGRGAEALQRLQASWHDVWARDSQADFVTSYAWFAAYLDVLEEEPDKLLVLSLHIGGDCQGILPLIQRQPQSNPLRPTRLELPLLTGMDLNRFLLADGQQLDTWWPEIRQQLKANGIPFFVIKANNVLLDTPSRSRLTGLEATIITRIQGHSCWFDCSLSFHELHDRYRSRLKKILRKGYRGLEREGELTFRKIDHAEDLTHAYQQFLQLEASGWKGEKGSASALALAPRLKQFHESFLFTRQDDVTPQVNLLYCGDRAIAAQLCVRHGNSISLLKIAYDQSFARLSPGSVLLDQLLQQCCQNHSPARVNLITGQPWMDNWAPQKTPVADVWIFDRALVASVVRQALSMRNKLRSLLERIQRRAQ